MGKIDRKTAVQVAVVAGLMATTFLVSFTLEARREAPSGNLRQAGVVKAAEGQGLPNPAAELN